MKDSLTDGSWTGFSGLGRLYGEAIRERETTGKHRLDCKLTHN